MKQQVQQPAPVSRTLQGKAKTSCQASVSDVLQAYKKDISQRQEIEDDDELLQGKFETTQRDELEDDELLQGKFETAQRDELDDVELLQGKFETTQREELEDDEELLQGKFEPTQRQETPNNTGLPDNLKAGVEQLSGLDMSDVKVHYNSSKPANVQAYAYTQGTDIHVAPGQEKHLGHEAWHVAQQKQGRVQPTTTVGDIPVNDNVGLEKEADVMGGKAVQMKLEENKSSSVANSIAQKKSGVKQGFGFVDNRAKSVAQRVNNKFASANTGRLCKPKEATQLMTIQRALVVENFLRKKFPKLHLDEFERIVIALDVPGKQTRVGGTNFRIYYKRNGQVQTYPRKFHTTGLKAHGRVGIDGHPATLHHGMVQDGEPLDASGEAGLFWEGIFGADDLAQICDRETNQGLTQSAFSMSGVHNSQLLHVRSLGNGGENGVDNVQAGTHAVNTAQIPVDNMIFDILSGHELYVKISTYGHVLKTGGIFVTEVHYVLNTPGPNSDNKFYLRIKDPYIPTGPESPYKLNEKDWDKALNSVQTWAHKHKMI